jgi:hypothetical protein
MQIAEADSARLSIPVSTKIYRFPEDIYDFTVVNIYSFHYLYISFFAWVSTRVRFGVCPKVSL